jgi:hypothetical protein
VKLAATWPALQVDRERLPPVAEYERGVWGKMHGAPTDFRWIARTVGFGRAHADLQMQLSLGGEDVPVRFPAWRNVGDRCYAISSYPSRAIDAAGRRDFLEKQVLEWHRPPNVPAALGALLLLPRAATLTDAIWWDRYVGELWTQPEIFLRIDDADHQPLAIDEDELGVAIERGRQQLREAVSADALAQLYDQLLAGRRPALLTSSPQPLPPEALAVLLLPLPRELADRISLAGWIPTDRPVFADLGSRWNVLALPTAERVSSSSSVARRMADSLLATEPVQPSQVVIDERRPTDPVIEATPIVSAPRRTAPFRPGIRFDLAEPEPGAPPILTELYELAVTADRRWLAPEMLKRTAHSSRLGGSAARLLASWIHHVSKEKPSYAHAEQWSVKVDLLRSAAIVLVPEPATVQAVGVPAADSRVPALFFGLLLRKRHQREDLAALGEDALRELVQQSTTCRASRPTRDSVRRWLEQWQQDSPRDLSVRELLADALATQRH